MSESYEPPVLRSRKRSVVAATVTAPPLRRTKPRMMPAFPLIEDDDDDDDNLPVMTHPVTTQSIARANRCASIAAKRNNAKGRRVRFSLEPDSVATIPGNVFYVHVTTLMQHDGKPSVNTRIVSVDKATRDRLRQLDLTDQSRSTVTIRRKADAPQDPRQHEVLSLMRVMGQAPCKTVSPKDMVILKLPTAYYLCVVFN